MDFSKAFDTFPHQRLLYTLQRYSIRGNTYRWIQSFLSECLQKVVVDGTSSTSVLVTSGVPQGSVLGPILFLIYINDLPECVKHSTVRLFADDCIIHRPITSYEDTLLLQQDINSLRTWSTVWLMNFNVSKCYYVNVTQSTLNKISTEYYLHDCPLTKVDNCKYLGVVLQSDLNWKKHIDEKVTKANNTLAILRKLLLLRPRTWHIKP